MQLHPCQAHYRQMLDGITSLGDRVLGASPNASVKLGVAYE